MNMRKAVAAMALLLAIPGFAPAQETRYPPWYDAYIYFGRDNKQMGQTGGIGGEGSVYRNLGLDLELGMAGFGGPAVLHHHTIGIGSADATYHLFRKSVNERIVPFASAGYSPFFGQVIKLPNGAFEKSNVQHGYNVGAGIDIWSKRRVGARFDVRYYAHGGRILYNNFPNLSQLSFMSVRFALTVR